MKALRTLLIATTASIALAACSDDDSGDGGHGASAPDIPASADFNGADVQFATNMIQHHAQALAMVDLVRQHDVSRPVARLAEAILAAQGPEIELMTDWLTDWDQPVPETVRDHANAHGDGEVETDSDMPGMMSEEDMHQLETARDAEFEEMWLEMMIEHHEGAVAMAETQQGQGEFPDAVDLAEAIESAQQAEIDRMEQILGS